MTALTQNQIDTNDMNDDLSHPLDKHLAKMAKAAPDEASKGASFASVCKTFLEKDPVHYSKDYVKVMKFSDYAREKGIDARDTGIDLVAERLNGTYAAIQCKYRQKGGTVQTSEINSFISEAVSEFDELVIMHSMSQHSSWVADHKIAKNDVVTIGIEHLRELNIDWEKFFNTKTVSRGKKKELRGYQKKAVNDTVKGLTNADRGHIVMACGTGKTIVSLKIAEKLAGKGKTVLFLVPSLALMTQTLQVWGEECDYILPLVVCGDGSIGKRKTGGSNDDDTIEETARDIPYPASTNYKKLNKRFGEFNASGGAKDNMVVVFSTYQSVDRVSEAQQQKDGAIPAFDLVVCDEAHRTTGAVTEKMDKKAANFRKIHENRFVEARKRLYMTATPKVFTDTAITKGANAKTNVYSMDDGSEYYGKRLHTLGFAKALGLKEKPLCDYKVIVLGLDEDVVPREEQEADDQDAGIGLGARAQLIGVFKTMAKDGIQGISDAKNNMSRAIMYCARARPKKDSENPNSSMEMAHHFEKTTKDYLESEWGRSSKSGNFNCEVKHVDGYMDGWERKELMNWLKGEKGENTCHILSNKRCLSEGVDVPALDAVIFMHASGSPVDVIQSVGRVMRASPGKEFGYIIIPVGVPAGWTKEKVLEKSKKFEVVWKVVNALRSNDERLDQLLNAGALGQSITNKVQITTLTSGGKNRNAQAAVAAITDQLPFSADKRFANAVVGQIVEKCGTRTYWDAWATHVGESAVRYAELIRQKIGGANSDATSAFDKFLAEVQDDLNNSITRGEAIKMLAQHVATLPVFQRVFNDGAFVAKNPVSIAMTKVLKSIDLREERMEGRMEQVFEGIRQEIDTVTDPAAQQSLIKILYGKFFGAADKKNQERHGIVYTPTEIVDFILRSVNDVLTDEFGETLGSKGVQILDPFTGTGTFIARLLDLGLIPKETLKHKFKEEIHANEITLLAYYIAAVNIEMSYSKVMGGYEGFRGICLSDTFQMYEQPDQVALFLADNSERRENQVAQDIKVIVGNPPYSARQGNQDDKNQNIKYEVLDKNIKSTYASYTDAKLKAPLYDSYIRAIRWASNRLRDGNGVVSFITGGGILETGVMSGVRKCLVDEFSSIYVINLRGDSRKRNKAEGGSVFSNDTSTSVAIFLFVKNTKSTGAGKIHYHDIGEYLSTNQKIEKINLLGSIRGIDALSGWETIKPDKHNDWLGHREDSYSELISIGSKSNMGEQALFSHYTLGVVTNRDAWCYNASRKNLESNINRFIAVYQQEVSNLLAHETDDSVGKYEVLRDPTKIKWTRSLEKAHRLHNLIEFQPDNVRMTLYRPFTKRWMYFCRSLNECVYRVPSIFPNADSKNMAFSITGKGARWGFSVIMTDVNPNLELVSVGQVFAQWHETETSEKNSTAEEQHTMLPEGQKTVSRKESVSEYGLKHFQSHYRNGDISRDDIFYYVYGLLHSEQYREKYKDNIRRELPRIPMARTLANFHKFSEAGKRLGNLHVNFESAAQYPADLVRSDLALEDSNCDTELYRVEKMEFIKKDGKIDLSRVKYNKHIMISGIPTEAWQYVVNGRSALKWVMDYQKVRIDQKSGIKNDPNLYAIETMNDPAYPLKLFLSVISVSLETLKTIKELPDLDIDD